MTKTILVDCGHIRNPYSGLGKVAIQYAPALINVSQENNSSSHSSHSSDNSSHSSHSSDNSSQSNNPSQASDNSSQSNYSSQASDNSSLSNYSSLSDEAVRTLFLAHPRFYELHQVVRQNHRLLYIPNFSLLATIRRTLNKESTRYDYFQQTHVLRHALHRSFYHIPNQDKKPFVLTIHDMHLLND